MERIIEIEEVKYECDCCGEVGQTHMVSTKDGNGMVLCIKCLDKLCDIVGGYLEKRGM